MTTVCYHHRAEKANICAMFLSYQCFRERWRSLGDTASAHGNTDKTGTNQPDLLRECYHQNLPPINRATAVDGSRPSVMSRWPGVQLGYCCRSALSLINPGYCAKLDAVCSRILYSEEVSRRTGTNERRTSSRPRRGALTTACIRLAACSGRFGATTLIPRVT
jgi:hypothetical protein